jgi:hypothetical protein
MTQPCKDHSRVSPEGRAMSDEDMLDVLRAVTGLFAFPRPASVFSTSMQSVPAQAGMTLLDHYAGIAMQVLLKKSLEDEPSSSAYDIDSGWWNNTADWIAERAYAMAGCMVRARQPAIEHGVEDELKSREVDELEGGAACS